MEASKDGKEAKRLSQRNLNEAFEKNKSLYETFEYNLKQAISQGNQSFKISIPFSMSKAFEYHIYHNLNGFVYRKSKHSSIYRDITYEVDFSGKKVQYSDIDLVSMLKESLENENTKLCSGMCTHLYDLSLRLKDVHRLSRILHNNVPITLNILWARIFKQINSDEVYWWKEREKKPRIKYLKKLLRKLYKQK